MFDESGLDQQLREARASLQQVRAAAEEPPPPTDVNVEVAEGRIRMTLGPEGRLTALEIQSAAMREGSEYVAAQILAGVNAALDAQAAPAAGGEPMPDLTAMTATVERLQDEGLRQMRQLTVSIRETMAQIQRN